MTPADIRKIRKATSLPLIVKGIMTPEDAEVAIENGADGIDVSNHGGRSMDCGEASIEALPKVVEHLKRKKATRNAEIFFDGGIRKGTDIIKALALGARGCLIGRPYFWALAVDRKNGAERVTNILKAELVRTAALCGIRDLSKVDTEHSSSGVKQTWPPTNEKRKLYCQVIPTFNEAENIEALVERLESIRNNFHLI